MSSLRDSDAEEAAHRKNDWRIIKEKMAEFMQQNPKSHPLFEHATEMIPKSESVDFYRGFYASLMTTFHVIEASQKAAVEQLQNQASLAENAPLTAEQHDKATPSEDQKIEKTDFEQLWQSTMHDMLKLHVGVTMSRMLYAWPSDWIGAEEDN